MPDERTVSILVVDDNPVTRVLCSRALGREGYRVIEAEDGVEALRLIQDEPVDVVLLDVMMPGLNGFDVLETLRELYPAHELRILMVTAKDQSEDVVRAFELGADDYITKPLDLPVMLARVKAQLRSRRAGASPTRVAAKPEPGTVLEEKYRLESLIGHGTYGTVYRATHLGLERPVALKVLNAGIEKGGTERFQREAISACRIDHPNAVQVLDLAVTAGGLPFMVMELLEGCTLAEELKREGSLSLQRCAELLQPVCEVLGEAHALGIVHRDVKPQNIFLHQGRQGEVVKVLDFGIAKLVNDASLAEKLTLEGVVGTPSYMAPERFSGDSCDDRADVYSLGIVLYEMLAGQRPFASDGDFFKLIVQHMNDHPRPLRELRPELPPAIDRLVREALAKSSADRPPVTSLARRFVEALSHEEPIALG